MPVEHCLQNDTRPVKTSFTPLISVISVCFEYPSCTLQSFQHVIDFNLRVKIAVRILCTLPASLCSLLMGRKFTVWPWIFSLLELEPLLFFSAVGQLLAQGLLYLVCSFLCGVHQQHSKMKHLNHYFVTNVVEAIDQHRMQSYTKWVNGTKWFQKQNALKKLMPRWPTETRQLLINCSHHYIMTTFKEGVVI